MEIFGGKKMNIFYKRWWFEGSWWYRKGNKLMLLRYMIANIFFKISKCLDPDLHYEYARFTIYEDVLNDIMRDENKTLEEIRRDIYAALY